MRFNLRKRIPIKLLSFAIICCLATGLATAAPPTTTWYTSGSFDFTSIESVSYNSKFINASGVATFTIIGTAYGVSTGIGGILQNQDPLVVQRCLSLVEQFNISRRSGTYFLLRIQVMTDPSSSGSSLIQYCTLYQS